MRSSSSTNKHHHLMTFHLHLPHFHGPTTKKGSSADAVPKGFMVVRVGQQHKEGEGEGEGDGDGELQRFVVPVIYLNHPLFARLLKEAEEEYGFHQQGAITIPCNVEYFRQVRGLIDREAAVESTHHHHHLLHFHIHLSGWCFRP